MRTTIFFDLGNTVVDYHGGVLTDEQKDRLGLLRMRDRLGSLGCSLSIETLIDEFYRPWIERLKDRRTSRTEFPIGPFLSRIAPDRVVKPNLSQLVLDFHEPSARFAVANADIREVLSTLVARGVRIGLVSNSPLPGICHDQTLERLNLLQCFEPRLYSYDVGHRKPSPEIFIRAMRLTDSTPGECIMVGDSLELDMEPAMALGMLACHYSMRYETRESHTNRGYHRIDRFDALLDLLDT